jgi:inhibitor of growth protein 3
LTDADEKVQLSNQMYDLVERYLRRLDTELYKFKCELEADNNGITEILEKRSLELDSGGSHSMKSSAVTQKENRYFGSIGVASGGSGAIVTTPTSHTAPAENRYRKQEKRRDSTNLLTPILSAGSVAMGGEKRPTLASSLSMPSIQRSDGSSALLAGAASSGQSTVSSSSSMFGAGSANAIVKAVSQAIVATQQMQQGRRTASLKASFEAIHGGSAVASSGSHDLLLGAAMQAVDQRETSSFSSQQQQQRKHKKKISSTSHGHLSSSSSSGLLSSGSTLSASSSSSSQLLSQQSSHDRVSTTDSVMESSTVLDDNGMAVETTADEWTYDPNEPRYCICNQVSYGDMVACDNESCPFEWFHYPCVGITSSPKGKWYCPQCIAAHKRRGTKK